MLMFILHNNLIRIWFYCSSSWYNFIFYVSYCTVKIWFLTVFRSVCIKKTNLHFIYLLLFLKF